MTQFQKIWNEVYIRIRRKDFLKQILASLNRSISPFCSKVESSAQEEKISFCVTRYVNSKCLHQIPCIDPQIRRAGAGSNLHGAFRALALIEFLHVPAANETCSNLRDLPHRSVFGPRFKVSRKGGRSCRMRGPAATLEKRI